MQDNEVRIGGKGVEVYGWAMLCKLERHNSLVISCSVKKKLVAEDIIGKLHQVGVDEKGRRTEPIKMKDGTRQEHIFIVLEKSNLIKAARMRL